MKRVSSQIIATILAFTFFIGCKKRDSQPEDFLSGTWVKGVNAGDTLKFTKKDLKNIMGYTISFSSASSYKEVEYRYNDGKLEIKKFSPCNRGILSY